MQYIVNNESQVFYCCEEVTQMKMEKDRMNAVVLDWNWKYQCAITD